MIFFLWGKVLTFISWLQSLYIVYCLMSHVLWKLVFPAPVGWKGSHILQFLRCYNVTHNVCLSVPSNVMDNTELHAQFAITILPLF